MPISKVLQKHDVRTVPLRGADLLKNPILTKGTAFSEEERDALGLRGLLPYRVFTLEEQVKRAYEEYKRKTSDIERNIYLSSLHDRNETVFFALLEQHLSEMTPMIYTPVEG